MEVEPVRDLRDVKRVYEWLGENYTVREAECWLIGCNIALRAGDLLTLRFDQIEQGQKTVVLNEKKTGKRKEIPITPTVRDAVARVRNYYNGLKPWKTKEFDPVYVFQSTSRRAYHLCQPVCIQYLSYCLKHASRALGFEFNFNTHSMRKTWGYQAYTNGADILYIQALLNHSNQHVTLKYIGITKSTIQQMYVDHTIDIAS